jgi:hypothetical protein
VQWCRAATASPEIQHGAEIRTAILRKIAFAFDKEFTGGGPGGLSGKKLQRRSDTHLRFSASSPGAARDKAGLYLEENHAV